MDEEKRSTAFVAGVDTFFGRCLARQAPDVTGVELVAGRQGARAVIWIEGEPDAVLPAAGRAGVEHVMLISAVGAGFGWGAQLQAKKAAEQALRIWAGDAARGFTILRPGPVAGDDEMTERPKMTARAAFLGGMGDTPFGYPFMALRPIGGQVLARIALELVVRGPQRRVLMGHGLFRVARELGLAPASSLDHLSG